ncbi:Potassium transport protein, high-affinity [Cordyceps fumosorosea ARSEF 2679]|uniref:Potassium transport protein n=1 Tax=Cordyceps fumosorosea (strain ARSEF 2679) TaxID=1081104 RepID=A0A167ZDA0_CORFA|nr:Potassium transport protein, high-affinity [Cordyceps fumosorosea ARSEF 2679]OAA67370.1 Potassium transport protein, high-affinity [Cordyceps fumosorosea ARSEF 2679]
MLGNFRSNVWAQLKAIKPAFVSKNPHFNFITAHYFWIVGATIVGSICIYAGGTGHLAYIDALLFASGANTQAGLNPVDVNLLTTFQQVVIYVLVMLSNPITLHGSVVILRIYWFEKRFQGWVREVRSRRPNLTRSNSQAVSETHRAEAGVNGRHITVVPANGTSQRITNDGILLDNTNTAPLGSLARANLDSDTTASATDSPSTATPGNSQHTQDSDDGIPSTHGTATPVVGLHARADSVGEHTHGPTAITFADTVKRSDGLEENAIEFAQRRSNAQHIAILERQRNEDDNEVLRIPGPRDIERGQVPTRLGEFERDEALGPRMSRIASNPGAGPQSEGPYQGIRGRQPTVTIAEPDRPRRDVSDDAKALTGTLSAFRFRKPRLFNKSGQTPHHEEDPDQPPRPTRTWTLERIRSALNRDSAKVEDMPYLSYTPTMARNSNFVGLTLEQREELGGIEYRSLRTLAFVLLGYFWGFQIFGLVTLLPFIMHNEHYGKIVEDAGISRIWWGFFTPNVSFMDVGFTLTPDSMISFVRSEYVLMISCFLIILGNTGFPVMLRFIIWTLTKIIPKHSGLWEELKFLLDHPRRCFTLLFPSGPTWWLFWILITLNAVDLLFFIVLDLGKEPISYLPLHNRVVVGLFQAASTRTAGFSAVNLADLQPAMPVLYMIMMYISVFPIAISIRRTNVYEEKSLGVYDNHEGAEEEASALSYVGTHLRRQLSFDLWFVFLGFFLLCITEGSKIQAGRFEVFPVLFEAVSAYGTVGLSMGATGINASLCSQFSVVGKLIIAALQIRGRHRGLPYGLDKAVLLPTEARLKKEAEESEAVLARMNTAPTATTTGLQRSPSVARGRSMSRGRDSNIIAKFLHPGPVVQRDAGPARQRSRSNESRVLALERNQTYTEPQAEAEDQLERLPSGASSKRMQPMRAETAPTTQRTPWRP